MLDDDDLRDVDRTLLIYLAEGRVTPVYCQRRLEQEGHEYSRGYIQERLARFVEHDHAENLLGLGLYQLTDDPRSEDGGADG
jgi:hypothetical protein